MLRLMQVLRCGAAISALLGVSLLTNQALAQQAPPGGNSWAVPDLQAYAIEFSLLKQYDALGTKGRVRIRGVVTNCKGGTYYGTAHAVLHEQVGGQWRMVTGKKIPPLNTGAVQDVVHECDWDKNAPPAASYKLVVELAWGDGFNAADNPSNNVMVRSSEGLSALLKPVVQTEKDFAGVGNRAKLNWPKTGSQWDKFRRAK